MIPYLILVIQMMSKSFLPKHLQVTPAPLMQSCCTACLYTPLFNPSSEKEGAWMHRCVWILMMLLNSPQPLRTQDIYDWPVYLPTSHHETPCLSVAHERACMKNMGRNFSVLASWSRVQDSGSLPIVAVALYATKIRKRARFVLCTTNVWKETLHIYSLQASVPLER